MSLLAFLFWGSLFTLYAGKCLLRHAEDDSIWLVWFILAAGCVPHIFSLL